MPSLWQLMIGFQPIRGINLHRTFCAVTISNFRFYCLGLLAHFTSTIVHFFGLIHEVTPEAVGGGGGGGILLISSLCYLPNAHFMPVSCRLLLIYYK